MLKDVENLERHRIAMESFSMWKISVYYTPVRKWVDRINDPRKRDVVIVKDMSMVYKDFPHYGKIGIILDIEEGKNRRALLLLTDGSRKWVPHFFLECAIGQDNDTIRELVTVTYPANQEAFKAHKRNKKSRGLIK